MFCGYRQLRTLPNMDSLTTVCCSCQGPRVWHFQQDPGDSNGHPYGLQGGGRSGPTPLWGEAVTQTSSSSAASVPGGLSGVPEQPACQDGGARTVLPSDVDNLSPKRGGEGSVADSRRFCELEPPGEFWFHLIQSLLLGRQKIL